MESFEATGRTRASGPAAFVGVVTTLVLSTAVFVGFLMAPLIVLGGAFLLYVLWPGSSARTSKPAAAVEPSADADDADRPAYRFGTGG
ncbi:hypothetical protein [Aeromicrobium stalagmiti]|uniref:hypothetical protein n=1 Tax=Aeromicrobium stalagmiti TaxID=2738988 RepID=UPI001569389B|nr:hypothetical protein [Aeromicrobium stalagmiti]NRQ48281.1 hypothetical protein [Aeromicrobium stalagmiti]